MTSLRKSLTAFLFVLSATVLPQGIAHAAEINLSALNLEQGFNFRRDVQVSFGYLVSLKIGTTVIKPDILAPTSSTVISGTTPATTPVVGVLDSITWNTAVTGPIQVQFQVPLATRQALQTLQQSSLTGSVAVTFDFVVYNFDPQAKVYFPTFARATFFSSPATPLTAALSGSNGGFNVTSTASTGVTIPANFKVGLILTPSPATQQLIFASTSLISKTLTW